jgi:hypothetical protein
MKIRAFCSNGVGWNIACKVGKLLIVNVAATGGCALIGLAFGAILKAMVTGAEVGAVAGVSIITLIEAYIVKRGSMGFSDDIRQGKKQLHSYKTRAELEKHLSPDTVALTMEYMGSTHTAHPEMVIDIESSQSRSRRPSFAEAVLERRNSQGQGQTLTPNS